MADTFPNRCPSKFNQTYPERRRARARNNAGSKNDDNATNSAIAGLKNDNDGELVNTVEVSLGKGEK